MPQSKFDTQAIFLSTAMKEICSFDFPSRTTVLDFGCGEGELVKSLLSLGYDTYGCDIIPDWQQNQTAPRERLKMITSHPYRLPFDVNTYDVVVSNSVLEHVQNKGECFREIYRVLKPDGYAMHLFPGKWHLPYEPHFYVPLANFFWPRCPQWWLALWALLGVRNQFQRNKSWREVVTLNSYSCAHKVSYWSDRKYRALSLEVFGNFSNARDFLVRNSQGRTAKLLRRIPSVRMAAWLMQFRGNFIIQQRIKPSSDH